MSYPQHQSTLRGHALKHFICGGILFFIILTACTAAPPLPAGALPAITTQSGKLRSGESQFEVHGLNYIHPSSADLTKCPALQFGADANCPWELAPIAADFDKLQAQGVNTLRVFLNYYAFGGARAADPNYSVQQPLAHLDALIAEAGKRNMYVLPVLLAKYPQDRFRAEDYTMALDLHVRPVVRHLAGKPGLLAWDLFNEIDLGGPVDQLWW